MPCRKNKSKGQVFFEWANRIARDPGDVGNCGDVSILGREEQMAVLTSASKGNTTPLWLLVQLLILHWAIDRQPKSSCRMSAQEEEAMVEPMVGPRSCL